MVRRRVKRKRVRKTSVNDRVKDYRFVDDKRKNIPDAGLASFYREKQERRKYEYNPHLNPQLVWAGKAEHTSFEVDTVALHIHERFSTKAILKAVEKKKLYKQLKLFGEPDLPLDKRIEFYQHDMDWTNRLIIGDSLLVMNSLLEREMMARKVQMIYIDPPYGIDYSSNFQPEIGKRTVKDGQDDSLTREPEQIKAYRDTWSLGVHSYLTYLRDRFLLCRDLLDDSGSIFVQISDTNLHFVRAVLDEVFEVSNFCAVIPFRKKTMPMGTKLLEQMHDFLLWYAKDKSQVKYRQLFLEKDVTGDFNWRFYETPDGSRHKLTQEQIMNHKLLPKGARLFRLKSLEPSGRNESGIFSFEYKGKVYPHPKNGWATDRKGMDNLAAAGRLHPSGTYLQYVLYFDDYPVTALTAPWIDTSWSGFGERKIFVVQTNTQVIARCMLMTTDPGDLVFDPTCGGGTTAYVAEQWGRRWITCDTSRVALALARRRLLCAVVPFYKLAYPESGVSSGFVYETNPHITLRSIVKNEPPQTDTLYGRPIIERDKIRVSGPFTVEAIPIPSVEDPSLSTKVAEDYVDTMIGLVRKDGVTFPGSKHMRLENARPIESAGFLHAEAQTKQNGDYIRVALSFGPRHGPVIARQVAEGVRSAYMMGFNMIIFAGFAFDPEAQATIQKTPHPNLQVHMANIRPDVEMSDLLKSPKGSQLFTVFGQPDIKIRKKGEDHIVELLGVDIYNPITGDVYPSRPGDVAAWFLDQNYDGYTFCITQAFFPKEATRRNPWDKLEKALRGIVSKDRMEELRSTTSFPFKAGDEERIAVKVIDQRGNEVIVVKKLEEAIQG